MAAVFVAVGCASFHLAGGSDAPGTQPARPYRLVLRSVTGSQPPESVFVLVSPDGYPSVSTPSRLRWMIEYAVTAPATLN